MIGRETFPVWPGWSTVRLIGRGSFGAVYEIERDVFSHKEKAALKVITIPQSESDIDDLMSDGYDEESITARFKGYLQDIVREYSVMADMKGCVNIVYCDDVKYIQHDNGMGWDIFIKMELLTALPKTLGKKVTDEQVIKIGTDICSALAFCEKRNLLHRDIKPQNIFVAPDGTYKLGDFGIAKTAERTTSATKAGTYKYMAPEVYNNQPYGGKADIYSLGLVLYWLLNERRTPFLPLPPTTPTSTEEDKARGRRFRGESIPAPVRGSKELQRIVLKACAFDQKDRYQSAEEMLSDLAALSASDSTTELAKEETGGSPIAGGSTEFIPVQGNPAPDVGREVLPGNQADNASRPRWSSTDGEEDDIQRRSSDNMWDKFEGTEKTVGAFGAKRIPDLTESTQQDYPARNDTSEVFSGAEDEAYYGFQDVQAETGNDWDLEKEDFDDNPDASSDWAEWQAQREAYFQGPEGQAGWDARGMGGMQKKSSHGLAIAAVLSAAAALLLIAVIYFSGNRSTQNATNNSGHSTNTSVSTTSPTNVATPATNQSGGTQLPNLTASVSQYAPSASRLYFDGVYASSEYSQDNVSFPASNVIDDNSADPWVEGVRGSGIGETLIVYFDSTKSVSVVSFRLGYAQSEYLYENNNRPSRLRISFSDGTSVECDFQDLRQEMYVYLSRPVDTWYIEITILEVYTGTEDDTCIAAVRAYGS